jgi:CDP-diacylglycerol pyrophosphatase
VLVDGHSYCHCHCHCCRLARIQIHSPPHQSENYSNRRFNSNHADSDVEDDEITIMVSTLTARTTAYMHVHVLLSLAPQ